jgi:hypothetical protein
VLPKGLENNLSTDYTGLSANYGRDEADFRDVVIPDLILNVFRFLNTLRKQGFS